MYLPRGEPAPAAARLAETFARATRWLAGMPDNSTIYTSDAWAVVCAAIFGRGPRPYCLELRAAGANGSDDFHGLVGAHTVLHGTCGPWNSHAVAVVP